MLYCKIESLLVEYHDILVHLELLEGNDSVFIENDLIVEKLHLMKQEMLINFTELLSLPKETKETVIIEKVENYLMNFQ